MSLLPEIYGFIIRKIRKEPCIGKLLLDKVKNFHRIGVHGMVMIAASYRKKRLRFGVLYLGQVILYIEPRLNLKIYLNHSVYLVVDEDIEHPPAKIYYKVQFFFYLRSVVTDLKDSGQGVDVLQIIASVCGENLVAMRPKNSYVLDYNLAAYVELVGQASA